VTRPIIYKGDNLLLPDVSPQVFAALAPESEDAASGVCIDLANESQASMLQRDIVRLQSRRLNLPRDSVLFLPLLASERRARATISPTEQVDLLTSKYGKHAKLILNFFNNSVYHLENLEKAIEDSLARDGHPTLGALYGEEGIKDGRLASIIGGFTTKIIVGTDGRITDNPSRERRAQIPKADERGTVQARAVLQRWSAPL
jgi:hypothetical protein